MKGKDKCKILKQIRQKIANENDIHYVTSECKHQGDCAGTCPKCEAELMMLEKELKKRQSIGKRVTVAGIAAALVVSTSACDIWENTSETLAGAIMPIEETELIGEVPYVESTVPVSTDDEGYFLMGDVAYEESATSDTGITP